MKAGPETLVQILVLGSFHCILVHDRPYDCKVSLLVRWGATLQNSYLWNAEMGWH